jgi:asparagine synthase (glutamine-hydrolysing)
MFQNIYKLRQGHYALYKNGDFKVEKYWELDFPKHRGDPRETRERLFCAMEESVRKRLLADVPVGVFLSGGLDSSTVTGFVTRHYPGKVETFSIGYRDRSFSELPFAERVSRYYGTGHNVLMIDPVSPEDIEKSLYHLDEPMTDLSTIPFHLISAKAREKVKVCLSGEGGDEIFLGYDRFRAAKIHRWYRAVPGWLRSGMIDPLVMRLPDQRQKKGAVNMLKRFIEGGMYPEEVGAMRWQFFLRPETEKALFRPGAAERILMEPFGPLYDLVKECGSRDRVDRDIFVDMKLTMADSVLMKVDKMSMATSLEVRVPFLDHEVVELCASIPGDWKLEGLTTKAVLRKTLKEHDFLPPDIIDRGKQGYSLPVKNWLREDLLDFMTHLLTTSRLIDEYLEPQTVRRLIDEHVRREHNHNHILWALVNVALWYRRFFE